MHWIWEVAGRTLGKEMSIYPSLEAKGSTTRQKKKMRNPVFLSCGMRKWGVVGEMVTLVYCWWEYKMMQLLWKTAKYFFKKIENRVTIWSSNSTSGELKAGILRDTTIPLFIAGSFAGAKQWKQPKCVSQAEWINKMWSIPAMDLKEP